MSVPTEEDFRATGWTVDAVNYPISDAAFAYRCRFNNIDPALAPPTWHYAPNEWVQQDLETKAQEPNQ